MGTSTHTGSLVPIMKSNAMTQKSLLLTKYVTNGLAKLGLNLVLLGVFLV